VAPPAGALDRHRAEDDPIEAAAQGRGLGPASALRTPPPSCTGDGQGVGDGPNDRVIGRHALSGAIEIDQMQGARATLSCHCKRLGHRVRR